MFKWFKKKEKEQSTNLFHKQETIDAIEESLWEIKEEYDLPTEEIVNVVYSKRKNLNYMHERILKKIKEKL